MQDAVVRAAEAELVEELIRIADEVAIGKEQKLDEVPVWLAGLGCGLGRSRTVFARRRQTDIGHYVSTIDIFRFDYYPQKREVTATARLVRPRREVARSPKGAVLWQTLP